MFGVKPQSIPDCLAVVGDSADGFPGIPGWGAKAAARRSLGTLTLKTFRRIGGNGARQSARPACYREIDETPRWREQAAFDVNQFSSFERRSSACD
jgi:hypothetical protein